MPAPAYDKTWQFSLDNLLATSGNSTTDHKSLLLLIKNVMKNGNGQWSTNTLTVVGSSDGTDFGLDGVDRWATAANINTNAWLILRDSNATSKFEILLRYISAGGGEGQMQIHVSRLAGFGAANGGTNGSATVAPTATDGDVGVSISIMGSVSAQTSRVYGWRSSDGEFTRIAVRNASGGAWHKHWFWGKPKAPAGGIPDLWSPPVYYSFSMTSFTSSPEGLTNIRAYKGTTLASAIYTSCSSPNGNIDMNTGPSSWRSVAQFAAHEVHIHSFAAGVAEADLGIMWDTYGVTSALVQGEMAPLSGAKTWAVYGDTSEKWLLPHNNTTLKLSTAP